MGSVEPMQIDIEEIEPIPYAEVQVHVGSSPAANVKSGQWLGTWRSGDPATLYDAMKTFIDNSTGHWGKVVKIEIDGSFIFVKCSTSYYLKSDFGWNRLLDPKTVYVEWGVM